MKKTPNLIRKMVSNKKGHIEIGLYLVLVALIPITQIVLQMMKDPSDTWHILALGLGSILLGVIVFLVLYRLMNMIPIINHWFQPFYRKPCKKCNHPFSIRDDMFRNHLVTGVRYTTCKKCGTTNFALYDGELHIKEENNELSNEENPTSNE